MEFINFVIENNKTPVLMPKGYKVHRVNGTKIEYINDKGELILSDLYMHHSENVVLVDEFRKYIAHDSLLVVMFANHGEDILLQIRNEHMRWEPGKVDLASIAAQRRAILVNEHYEKIDNFELVYKKMREETGLPKNKVDTSLFGEVGQHFNLLTNEYQTIFVYSTDSTAVELNTLMEQVAEIDRPKGWLQQNYLETINAYFNDDAIAEQYAGGLDLRAKGFFSNSTIRNNIEIARKK